MTQQHIDNDTLGLFVKTISLSAAALPDAGDISSASYDEILDQDRKSVV